MKISNNSLLIAALLAAGYLYFKKGKKTAADESAGGAGGGAGSGNYGAVIVDGGFGDTADPNVDAGTPTGGGGAAPRGDVDLNAPLLDQPVSGGYVSNSPTGGINVWLPPINSGGQVSGTGTNQTAGGLSSAQTPTIGGSGTYYGGGISSGGSVSGGLSGAQTPTIGGSGLTL